VQAAAMQHRGDRLHTALCQHTAAGGRRDDQNAVARARAAAGHETAQQFALVARERRDARGEEDRGTRFLRPHGDVSALLRQLVIRDGPLILDPVVRALDGLAAGTRGEDAE
jgi:hypothetical protein